MTANTFYHFDGDPADEAAWQRFVAEHRVPSAGIQKPITTPVTAVKQLTELFLLFVVVVALVGTVLWQQNNVQTAELEAEVQQLENEIVALSAQPAVDTTAARDTSSVSATRYVVETTNLRFVASEEGMAIVHTLATDLDQAYGVLRTDLAPPAESFGEKLTIYLYNGEPDRWRGLDTNFDVLVIDLATIPVNDDDSDIATDVTYDYIYGQLARRLLGWVTSSRRIYPTWSVLVSHLYESIAQPEPVQTKTTLQPLELSERRYAQRLSPSSVAVSYEPGTWIYPDFTVANLVADPLIEYILASYGTQSIPPLLDACATYQTWDAVVPAVLGVTAEEFRTDWHAYLAEKYPIELIARSVSPRSQ